MSILRKEDRKEIKALGFYPYEIPRWIAVSDQSLYFHTPHDFPAGVAGVIRDGERRGLIWMMTTPAIKVMPFIFVRGARVWLDTLAKDYDLLHNICDKRNVLHHKLLKHLGFKAIREVPAGPDHLPFYEIVKLCVAPL